VLLSRNPSVFPDCIELKVLDPGLKPAGVTHVMVSIVLRSVS